MSQKKVDDYKEKKKNRKKIMRHEKFIKRLEITCAVVVLAGLIGWFSVAVYHQVKSDAEENQEVSTTQLDNSAVDNYISDLQTSTSSSSSESSTSSSSSESSTSTSSASESSTSSSSK